jgi:hypothetical protein
MQALSQASGNASRFETSIHAIHAVIAFDDLAGFRVPLGHSPGARGYAALAADTQTLIYEYNAVLGPFLYRTRRTNMCAERALAVETGQEMIVHANGAAPHPGTDLDDSAQSRPNWQVVLHLAMKLATVAPDTAFGIVVQVQTIQISFFHRN